MKKMSWISLLVFVFLFTISDAFCLYRQEIILTNSTATALGDFQVNINLTSAQTVFWANVKNDGGDIRFYDAVNNSISYWAESFSYAGKTASIWVKVPSIPDNGSTKIYLDCGDNSLTTLSSTSSTFDFYDTFDSFDTAKWTATGAKAVGSSTMTVSTGSVYSNSAVASQPGSLVEARVKWNNLTLNGGLEIANATASTISNSTSKKLVYLMPNASTSIRAWAADGSAASCNITAGTQEQFVAVAGTNYVLGLAVTSTNVLCFKDYVVTSVDLLGTWTDSFYIFLGWYGGSASGTANCADTVVDWVRVRKYAAADPTTTFGSAYKYVCKANVYISKDNIGVDGVQVTLTKLSDSSTAVITTASYAGAPEFYVDTGTYRLSLSKSGYIFVPNNIDITVGTSNVIQKISAFTVPLTSEVQMIANPFTPTSTDTKLNKVSFLVGNTGSEEINLKIYNRNGGFIREISVTANEISWDGKDSGGTIVSGGVYLYQLKLGSSVVKKGTVVLIK
ncbi:MAG: DUF2341 domain-containing protein [Candidatus Firestonebacteria bacterium]